AVSLRPDLQVNLVFTPEHRQLTPAQLKSVLDCATCKASGSHILLLASHNSLDHPRLGLVIPKKNFRLFVDHNKVKRIARESVTLHRAELDNLDIVVLARKGMGELDNAALHVLFRDMWRRLNKAADKYHRSSNSGRPSSNA